MNEKTLDMDRIKDLTWQEMENYSYHIYDEGRGIYLKDIIEYMDRVDEAIKRYDLCNHWDEKQRDFYFNESSKMVDDFWDYCNGITNEVIIEYIRQRWETK